MAGLKNIVKTMKKALTPSTYTTVDKPSVAILPRAEITTIPKHDHPLLNQLMRSRQFIEVSINTEHTGYQSMILAVDNERELLWLDDLYPLTEPLKIGDILHIKHHRNGEVLVFQAPVVALGVNFNSPGTALLLPEYVQYSPRRKYSRHTLSTQAVRAKIRALGEEPRYGSIINLSAGGMRLAIAGNVLSELHLNALLPLCQFKLSSSLSINCHARVKSYKMARAPYRHTQVSLEFSGISPVEQGALQSHLEQLRMLVSPQAA